MYDPGVVCPPSLSLSEPPSLTLGPSLSAPQASLSQWTPGTDLDY
jgi:hypothetical protein